MDRHQKGTYEAPVITATRVHMTRFWTVKTFDFCCCFSSTWTYKYCFNTATRQIRLNYRQEMAHILIKMSLNQIKCQFSRRPTVVQCNSLSFCTCTHNQHDNMSIERGARLFNLSAFYKLFAWRGRREVWQQGFFFVAT